MNRFNFLFNIPYSIFNLNREIPSQPQPQNSELQPTY